jgi:hypothetical protein
MGYRPLHDDGWSRSLPSPGERAVVAKVLGLNHVAQSSISPQNVEQQRQTTTNNEKRNGCSGAVSMRLGWSATPPGQNPAYRPTRHHQPADLLKRRNSRPAGKRSVASSPKPIWPSTSAEATTRRPDGAISDETMRRAIEISRSVNPDGGTANFWLFGNTTKMLDRARLEVENSFRQAGYEIPLWPPELTDARGRHSCAMRERLCAVRKSARVPQCQVERLAEHE